MSKSFWNIESPKEYHSMPRPARAIKDELEYSLIEMPQNPRPEIRLVVAVLDMAVQDYREGELDISWFTAGEPHFLSFGNICNILSFNKEAIINQLYTF